MKKSDWIDYFEAVNSRSPEEHELAAALAAGEFEDESVQIENEVKEVVSKVEEESESVAPQSSETMDSIVEEQLETPALPTESEVVSTSVAEAEHASESEAMVAPPANEPTPVAPAQTIPVPQPLFENVKTNPQVQEWKQKGRDYFKWGLQSLKTPTADTESGNLIYSILTLAFASIFMSMAIVFFFKNILLSFVNITIGGESIEFSQPEFYDRMVDSINSGFGAFAVIKVALILLVFYLISILIPALVNGLAQNKLDEIKERLAHSSRFAPLLLIVNILAFLTTFLMKNSLVVSEETQYELAELIYNSMDNPASSLTQFLEIAQKVPALESIMQVGTHITFLAILGFVVLLVAFIKNTRISYKKIDEFYISVGLVCILLVITIATNKFIYGSVINAFEDIYHAFSN